MRMNYIVDVSYSHNMSELNLRGERQHLTTSFKKKVVCDVF